MVSALGGTLLAFLATEVQATPRNVKVVSRGQHGVPAPNGKLFAYDLRGDVVISNVSSASIAHRLDVPKTHCGRGYCEGMGVLSYVWSPRSNELAYSVDTGKKTSGVYVYNVKTRRTRKITGVKVLQMSFTPAGKLIYLTGKGTHRTNTNVDVWMEGDRAPLFKLPDRADPKLYTRGQRNILGGRWIVTEVNKRDPRFHYAALEEVWATEIPSGRAIKLPIPPRSGGVTLSPAEDRVCYFEKRVLACIDLATHKRTVVSTLHTCGWRDSGDAPWSASGNRLSYRVCRGNETDVYVYDFTTRRTYVAARNTRYAYQAFQTEDYLLLLHRQTPEHWSQLLETVGRVDLASGRRYALTIDRTSYPHAMPISGRADRLYLARDIGGTTQLAWMDTSRPIGPVKELARPASGTWIEYQANGKPYAKLTYKRGLLNGPAQWFDWRGKRITHGQHVDGKRRGIWTSWRPNGRKDKVIDYQNHRQTTLWWYRWEEAKAKAKAKARRKR